MKRKKPQTTLQTTPPAVRLFNSWRRDILAINKRHASIQENISRYVLKRNDFIIFDTAEWLGEMSPFDDGDTNLDHQNSKTYFFGTLDKEKLFFKLFRYIVFVNTKQGEVYGWISTRFLHRLLKKEDKRIKLFNLNKNFLISDDKQLEVKGSIFSITAPLYKAKLPSSTDIYKRFVLSLKIYEILDKYEQAKDRPCMLRIDELKSMRTEIDKLLTTKNIHFALDNALQHVLTATVVWSNNQDIINIIKYSEPYLIRHLLDTRFFFETNIHAVLTKNDGLHTKSFVEEVGIEIIDTVSNETTPLLTSAFFNSDDSRLNAEVAHIKNSYSACMYNNFPEEKHRRHVEYSADWIIKRYIFQHRKHHFPRFLYVVPFELCAPGLIDESCTSPYCETHTSTPTQTRRVIKHNLDRRKRHEERVSTLSEKGMYYVNCENSGIKPMAVIDGKCIVGYREIPIIIQNVVRQRIDAAISHLSDDAAWLPIVVRMKKFSINHVRNFIYASIPKNSKRAPSENETLGYIQSSMDRYKARWKQIKESGGCFYTFL